jgi:hypothetical protein
MLDFSFHVVYPHDAMKTQNRIKRTLTQPEVIAHIKSVLDGNDIVNRTELADQLSKHYGLFDSKGDPQRASCLKALRELEQKGHFVLPASRMPPVTRSPRRLLEPVAAPQGVPSEAGNVCGLKLILVEREDQMRIWNEMMICEHPRGAGPLVGRQLYYLIDSEHGLLGGMGFGAAALHLADRDSWIGWDWEMRQEQLDRVIGLSRFLIRPEVHCHNLASHLLALAMRKMVDDFSERYGYRPWLVESFVDKSSYSGTCYRAANWVRVGRTQGRGRQDRDKRMAETIKDIYVYPLEKNFRTLLGLPPDSGRGALQIADGLGEDTWAEKEFAGAPLGDKRLSQRLVDSACAKARMPSRAFSGVAHGNWPAVKGYYRLIDQPDSGAVSMENILLPHRERTIRRMKGQEVVLCIQDGTDLNYSNLDQCEGLGVIGSNQTGAKSRGLHLHTTFVATPDGLPLGVLMAQCTSPGLKSKTDERKKQAVAIEEKETFSWILGLRDCTEVAADMPHTRIISVMDREADFFELFDEHRKKPSVDLLVRAKHNRCTTGELKLFDALKESPVLDTFFIHVDRQSARPKKSKQKARQKRAGRKAEVSLRYQTVEIRPPADQKDKAPIALFAVHVIEDNPPEGVEAIEWFLLTTVEIKSLEDGHMCLHWYCRRWRIEDWHRVLKSGCRVEDAAHKTAERLKRSVAINLVIGWRIMLMTLLGREVPQLPAEVLFSDLELEVLDAYAKKKPHTALSPRRSGVAGGTNRRLSRS